MAVRVSNADFEEKVLKEKLTVLVDFYSDSCVACKKLAPVLGLSLIHISEPTRP